MEIRTDLDMTCGGRWAYKIRVHWKDRPYVGKISLFRVTEQSFSQDAQFHLPDWPIGLFTPFPPYMYVL